MGKLLWTVCGLSLFVAMVAYVGHRQPILEGRVVSKHYEPARTWVQIVPIATGKVTMVVPITHFDDEDWIIRVDDGERQQNVYLTEDRYDQTDVGDWWSKDPYDQLTDRHEKVRK